MPNCSKAPRGLFVLVEIGRVFTATAISPSKGSRQLLARYAFRAGRNLPDKELRLLSCYLHNWSPNYSAACLHTDRTLSSPDYPESGVLVSEDSFKIKGLSC